MLRIVLAFVIGLPFVANAQENIKYFYTQQQCMPMLDMVGIVETYQEEILFTTLGVQFDTQGNPYDSVMLFTVNQDSGTWSLISIYADGMNCVVASGGNFEPFVD